MFRDRSSGQEEAGIVSGQKGRKLSKTVLATAIVVLIALVSFVALFPTQISNAYAPGPLPGVQNSVSETDIPVYIASASDPYSVFLYTGGSLSLQFASGIGDEIYSYLHVNPTQTVSIPTGDVVSRTFFNVQSPSDNMYMYVANGGGRNYGTVGADIQTYGGPPTVDQYININYGGQLGYPTSSSSARCNLYGSFSSVDTGGEERWGIVSLITNPSQSIAYEITGGLILHRWNGESDLVILVNTQKTTSIGSGSFCKNPTTSFSSSSIDWAIRAPPFYNTVKGDYQLYQTTGGSLQKSSTSMTFLEYIDSDATTTMTTTSSSTSTTVTTTSSSTTASSNTTQTSSTTETTTATTNTTTTCTTQICENPYWNPNSQEVATYVADNLFNPQVGLIATSSLEGCVDYVGGLPCVDTFWTTSDNVPAGWALQDFGYSNITQAIIKECNYLQCSGPNSGDRYEAYLGWPIAIGSPGDIHGIFSPDSDKLAMTCSTSGCGDTALAYGKLSDGTSYKIQTDVYTGEAGSPSTSAPVDVVGPQAINYYIRGDMSDSMKYANALVSLWNGYSVDGVCTSNDNCDTWHLGQVMFVMRVLGLDTSNNTIQTVYGTETYSQVFNQMENELWAIQTAFNCKGGCMPNSYIQTSPGGGIVGTGGVDAENQDAALLPFSYTLVSTVRADFGEYSMPGGVPNHLNRENTASSLIAAMTPLLLLSLVATSACASALLLFASRIQRIRLQLHTTPVKTGSRCS